MTKLLGAAVVVLLSGGAFLGLEYRRSQRTIHEQAAEVSTLQAQIPVLQSKTASLQRQVGQLQGADQSAQDASHCASLYRELAFDAGFGISEGVVGDFTLQSLTGEQGAAQAINDIRQNVALLSGPVSQDLQQAGCGKYPAQR